MRSLNKVQLIGHAGKDAEVRYTPGGTAVANVSLCTNYRMKKQDGTWEDHSEWHKLTFWKKSAENAGKYIKKGSRIFIEGRLHTASWEDKGETRWRTEVVVTELIFLDKLNGESEQGDLGGSGDEEIPF